KEAIGAAEIGSEGRGYESDLPNERSILDWKQFVERDRHEIGVGGEIGTIGQLPRFHFLRAEKSSVHGGMAAHEVLLPVRHDDVGGISVSGKRTGADQRLEMRGNFRSELHQSVELGANGHVEVGSGKMRERVQSAGCERLVAGRENVLPEFNNFGVALIQIGR